MNKFCDELVAEADKLLAKPDEHSFSYTAQRCYEHGYVAGMEMERKLLRLRLGLGVPADSED